MTIHNEHPFLLPKDQREPGRRLRGRMPQAVSLWASADGETREGWTISSLMVANGEPAEIVALVNEDADWWDLFRTTELATVNVLAAGQGWISDVFARTAPSPGGVFRTGEWIDAEHGPRLVGAAAWAGVRLVDPEPVDVGWSLLVRATIETFEIDDDAEALEHRLGRYR